MSTLVFVLVWVVLALGLLLVALSGGRGARSRLHRQSRRARTASYVAFGAAVLALGVGVPAVVIAAVQDRDSLPEAGISNLTAFEDRGRELFAEQCRQCHTLEAAAASAVVGPNLDEMRPPYALVVDAIRQGRARGNGAMAADLVVGDNVCAVAAFVAKAVGQEVPPDAEECPPPEEDTSAGGAGDPQGQPDSPEAEGGEAGAAETDQGSAAGDPAGTEGS